MDELDEESVHKVLASSRPHAHASNPHKSTFNHVSNIVKSINSQTRNLNESSGASSPTNSSPLLLSSSYHSNHAGNNLSRNSSSSISHKDVDEYTLLKKNLHSTSNIHVSSHLQCLPSNKSANSLVHANQQQQRKAPDSSSSKSLHACSSTSSSTSSLSTNNLNNLNYIEDCASSVFEDDLISNSSSKEKSHVISKSNRFSFSATNNYEDFDENEYETCSTHSSCNLSKLKIKQEEADFGVLVKECQLWIEVRSILVVLNQKDRERNEI